MVLASFFAIALSAVPLSFALSPVTNGTATSAILPSGTDSAGSPAQTVAVGKDGLTFTPDTIHAKLGDKIVFEFFPKNHAVVQADFNNPCNPSSDGSGIFSGFIPSPVGRANKTFTIKVADEKPIWLYCPQNRPKPHCAAGMVAVINPPPSGDRTLDAFKLAAAQTNATASTIPSGDVSGGQVTISGAHNASGDAPSPSPSANLPAGAASSLAVDDFVGMIAILAGVLS